MRYYKQFHGWPVHLLALLLGSLSLGVSFLFDDPQAQFGLLACAGFAFVAAWILWKGRLHYLDIDREWIVHHGFKGWRLRKMEVKRVEDGRKGWMGDRDRYLKVHASGLQYEVESGFLLNEERIEELKRALQGY